MAETQDEAPEGFAAAAGPYFEQAAQAGFPPFLTASADSDPLNATPYLGRYRDFFRRVASDPGRAPLLAALEWTHTASENLGVTVDAMLIGGSFTELSRPAPGDIDCLMLYRQTDAAVPIQGTELVALRNQAKARRVDVRHIPLDGDPLALVKCLCYFTILLSKNKHDLHPADFRIVRGLLLLDCR